MTGIGMSILEDGIEQGIQATIETVQELGGDKETAIEQIIKKFKLSQSNASEKVKEYWR